MSKHKVCAQDSAPIHDLMRVLARLEYGWPQTAAQPPARDIQPRTVQKATSSALKAAAGVDVAALMRQHGYTNLDFLRMALEEQAYTLLIQVLAVQTAIDRAEDRRSPNEESFACPACGGDLREGVHTVRYDQYGPVEICDTADRFYAADFYEDDTAEADHE